MINLLRISRSSSVITADVFEKNFKACLQSRVNFNQTQLDLWLPSIFGPKNDLHDWDTCCKNFARVTRDISFFSPNWEMIQLIPLLLQLRNQSGSRARLLLIAHSPAGYVQEWLQLRAVMVPGDVIVAPSRNAREIICYLCPDLEPFVKVIPHPIRPMPRSEKNTNSKKDTLQLMSLGRLSPHKLIHRQIEAVHIIKERGFKIHLNVVGPLKEPNSDQYHPYALSLMAKIKRLGLEENVCLKGAVYDESEKAALISGAQMMLNLSVTIEESFGKSPAEALGQGVPVIVTQWDGLPETIGEAGGLVPVSVDKGYNADISVDILADTILGLAKDPPSVDLCLRQGDTFSPHSIGERYLAILKKNLGQQDPTNWPDPMENPNLPLAPRDGILNSSAPLLVYSLADTFQLQWKHRRDMLGFFSEGSMFPNDEFYLRSLAVTCAQHYIALCMTGKTDRMPPKVPRKGNHQVDSDLAGTMTERLSRALTLEQADPLSKIITIQFLRATGLLDKDLFSSEKLDCIEDCGGKKFVLLEMLLFEKRYEQAIKIAEEDLDPDQVTEIDFLKIRQLGRICRISGNPQISLPWMALWLKKIPRSLSFRVSLARLLPDRFEI